MVYNVLKNVNASLLDSKEAHVNTSVALASAEKTILEDFATKVSKKKYINLTDKTLPEFALI